METFVIQTEGPSQTKAVKDALKALHVKMLAIGTEENKLLPSHVADLMYKGLNEADRKEFTINEDFMEYVKSKYIK
ncbi:hypothetical protein EZ449_16765 [Pedobacter frigidisoli]|uniref:Uncharacterized protein n=1 Tax=Pedobacter frigidisoli TaxID=2530455 RepID=A0A4R0NZK2_9SPHI|nr:hypothetical protein [Pedobacter frigidisoli]TCD04601.1 hypothetical protein EZ449_16765 [Pedobacter frigidisoli]